MRRLLLLLPLLAGCMGPDPYPSGLPTADQRQRDLERNLRDGRSWADQEELMGDVKGAFGVPSDADATGPKKAR